MRKNELLAYFAGLFDGEGSVYIGKRRTASKNPDYRLVISISNHCLDPLLEAQNFFGVGQIPKPRKNCYNLKIRSNQAATVLGMMLPFLMVRRRQALLALEFQARKIRKRLTTEELKIRENYKNQIHALNKKSRLPPKKPSLLGNVKR